MFDIGWSELLVIGIVALIAIGPKELPGVLRMLGQWMVKVRRMASDFQGQFNDAMREAEMSDLKKQVDDLGNTASQYTSAFDPVAAARKEFEDAVADKPQTDVNAAIDATLAAQANPPQSAPDAAPSVPVPPPSVPAPAPSATPEAIPAPEPSAGRAAS